VDLIACSGREQQLGSSVVLTFSARCSPSRIRFGLVAMRLLGAVRVGSPALSQLAGLPGVK
jgi:hypothetical protein